MEKTENRDFPGSPVVKNLPSNAGDMGLVPLAGNKDPTWATRPCVAMKDLTHNSEDPECHNKDFVCLNKDHSQKNAQNNKKPNKQTNAQNSKQTERKSLK